MTEGIDLEPENVASNEIAFVQVKGAAGQSVLDDYVVKFGERRERYHRMIFAVHTPRGTLMPPDGQPLQVCLRSTAKPRGHHFVIWAPDPAGHLGFPPVE